MNAPLFKFGAFSDGTSLLMAFAIGTGFGFFLERAGFGSGKKLASQFYLVDMSVLKVMFTAIITAMVGLTLLSQIGLVDLSQVNLKETRLWANLIGGLILGVGFVVGGYCPGTSVVAASTGRIDAMVYLGGIVSGMFAFGFAYPAVSPLVESASMGKVTIPAFFHLPYGVVVFAVCVMALGMFLGGEWVEMKVGKVSRDSRPLLGGRGFTPARLVLGIVLLGGLVAAFSGNPYRGTAVRVDTKDLLLKIEGKADHLFATDLAARLMAGDREYRIIDLRDPKDFGAYHIPEAENIPLSALADAPLPVDENYLLYSDGGIHGAQAWLLMKAKGYPRVKSLYGGIDEWKEQVLYPVLPESPGPGEKSRVDQMAQTSRYFGGSPRGSRGLIKEETPGLPTLAPVPSGSGPNPGAVPKKKKKEGC